MKSWNFFWSNFAPRVFSVSLRSCNSRVYRSEIFDHGLTHQVGRKQPLREDEVVELLLVEFRSEGLLSFPAKLQQPRVQIGNLRSRPDASGWAEAALARG